MDAGLLDTLETSFTAESFLAPFDPTEVKTSGENTRAWLTTDHFVKWATPEAYDALLRKDAAICGANLHAAIVRLHNSVQTADGTILVFARARGTSLTREGGSRERMSRLPLGRKLTLIQVVLDGMAAISAAGWIHRDFFDGNVMVDFDCDAVALYDFELYVRGPGYHIVEHDRDYGSSRLMAPEQFKRGAWVDQRTNVYTLARFAIQYLSDRHDVQWSRTFQASSGLADVLAKATRDDPDDRFETVEALVKAYGSAT